MIATRDFMIWVGNSGTVENPSGIVIVMKAGTPSVPVDLTGSEIVFRATNGAASIRKTGADGGITLDAPAGKITVPLTASETRSMQVGQRWAYEIERRIGGAQRRVLSGYLIPSGGINDDA